MAASPTTRLRSTFFSRFLLTCYDEYKKCSINAARYFILKNPHTNFQPIPNPKHTRVKKKDLMTEKQHFKFDRYIQVNGNVNRLGKKRPTLHRHQWVTTKGER